MKNILQRRLKMKLEGNRKEKFIQMLEKEIFNDKSAFIENYEDDWYDLVIFFEDLKNGQIVIAY